MEYTNDEILKEKLQTINELKSELDALDDEVKFAHLTLNRLGVGKEHWSLAGRIEALYIQLKKLTPQQAAIDPKLQP